MGFQAGKIYLLKWPEGHDLHGLEIHVRSVALGRLFELSRVVDRVQAARAGGTLATAGMDAINELLDVFASAVKWWNLEDEEGDHIPEGRAGLEQLELTQLIEAVLAWARQVTQVPAPLGKPSIQSGIPKIPMEPLTADLAS